MAKAAKSEAAEEKPCVQCLIARVDARVDQAVDAIQTLMSSGLIVAGVATEMSIRSQETQFWKEQVLKVARDSTVKHKKSCRLV